jgi:hypothetical protein
MELARLAHLIASCGSKPSLGYPEVTFNDCSLGRFPTPYPLLALNSRFLTKN